ncbi:monooxygenase [Aspergillus steynii IBT 23096]|uniref:Monooxygenase n=1 Tax=Aspergillus steynii IBT 23096 TaxID=1392250 RepID=A0A2I2GQ16_9EURO|nr:monooxygenase [Aspergillus steynii IBT 23096]PLB54959.1 monooxygenase [Aspergillus steynii IBT 23096]
MPLKVIVVGAGLGGLGAAIALNRSGHEVQVIEQSGFLNEVGAAIHMAPNATRVLRSWGVELESLRPVQCNHLDVWDAMGNHLWTPAVTKELQKSLDISDDWVLAHRVDLHNALRVAARREVNGRKVDIQLSSRVASVDSENGVVTLENGMTYTGDLIIGADGIHSKSVSGVTGEDEKKESTGQNCFRLMVPVSKMRANPLTASLVDKIGLDGVHAFIAPDRRLVIYPCRGGELLNIAGIHPSDPSSEARDASWLDSGSMDHLLETYKMFGPELQEMCRLAEDVKLWSLASRRPPSSFVKGKLALVGDAAHPTLPHQGQGGAQAFEDGAALGAIFTQDTTPEQIPQRLELYNKIRYDHAVTVMMMSKTHEERRGEMLDELRQYVPDAEIPKSMFTFTWGSDPAQEASDFLIAAN